MTCQPLEIILDNYCEDEPVAYMRVTEGFDSYLWSTGDVTSEITIIDPTPGTVFSVDVTSATGCTITLTDTLPDFETFEIPQFLQQFDTTYCEGESFWFVPDGIGLVRIFLDGYGQVFDSVLINALTSTTYEFVAQDDFGCQSDTMIFEVTVIEDANFADYQLIPVHCNEIDNGSINLTGAQGNSYSLDGINFQTGSVFDNLTSGDYTLSIIDTNLCKDAIDFYIDNVTPVSIINVESNQVVCADDVLDVTINSIFGTYPIEFSIDGVEYQQNDVFEDVLSGVYTVFAIDDNNCVDTFDFQIQATPVPEITDYYNNVINCNLFYDTLNIYSQWGISPIEYSIDGVGFQSSSFFSSVGPGSYVLTIRDSIGCIDTTLIELNTRQLPYLENIVLDDTSCVESTGFMHILNSIGIEPFNYSLNNIDYQTDSFFNGLSNGEYQVFIKDSFGCVSSENVLLSEISVPNFTEFEIQRLECYDTIPQVVIDYENGNVPFVFWTDYNTDQILFPIFKNVEQGSHLFYIEDNFGCKDTIEIDIPKISPLEIVSPTYEIVDCETVRIKIETNITNACKPYTVYFNDLAFAFEDEIEVEIPIDRYYIRLVDDCNCIKEEFLDISYEQKFFIPDVFNPSSTIGNEVFKIYSKESFIVNKYQIFDRWGGLIFQSNNDQNPIWWDGKKGNSQLNVGVYIYVFEIFDNCNKKQIFKGDVTLLK